ncbi:MAG: dUTP diphosphatase [Bacteroidetes bacterium]|nr:dUTP diphosphatase [Bacteroidota bacterium]
MSLKVKIINRSKNPLPQYQTEHSAGVDLCANIENDIEIKPLERKLIGTGYYIEIPEGYEAQIRPRSGLAAKSGITVINSPGTIDADYRGEIKVCLVNLSNENYIIKNGDRIAQMIFAEYKKVIFETTEEISETTRGDGGYGHTGK